MEKTAPIVITQSEDSPLYRYFRVKPEDFEDDSTFQVRMSSEYPGEQRAGPEEEKLGIAKEGEKYTEILSHNEGDVDLSRFTGDNRAPLLDEHKDNRHLGFIKTAALSTDKSIRGVVTFDKVSKLSKTRCAEVQKNSRVNFSLGYVHTGYLGTETLEGGKVGHRFSFRAVELSNVACPMDPTAQKGRGKNTDVHCIRCGDIYDRKKLNDDFMCPDCTAAEEPASDNRKAGDKMFRAKAKDGTEKTISHYDVRSAVEKSAYSDKRFKAKRDNGDMYSDFNIYDVEQRGDDFVAYVQSPAWYGPFYEVDFEYDGETAALGEAREVKPVQNFEPVERGMNQTTKWVRVDEKWSISFDSENSLNAQSARKENLTQNNMALKTAAELAAESPEAVAQIRTEAEKMTRTAVVSEYDNNAANVEEANKEVRALAEEAMKSYGKMWNGQKGDVIVCGAEIRKLEAEICRKDHTHDATERRTDFKRALDKIVTGAYAPKDPSKAAYLPDELAGRCSLRSLYNAAARSQERGERAPVFMPKEGAELEADVELRSQARNFPGGMGCPSEGVILPANMPCKGPRQIGRSFRGQAGRMQRDALAADFATAGALIAPEYRFPTIELLYNYMALSKAGITMISGVMGSPIVMPRMTSPTQSQSLPEGAILAEYDQNFDQVKFNPHRLGSKQIWTRLSMLQSGEDFEALIINDHMRINALRFDYLILNGQGAGDEPLGLMNQLGIGVVTFGGSASSAFKNCVALETAIRKANIDEEPTFITTSVARGTLRVTPATLTGSTVVSGQTNAIWDDDEIIGRPATDSQQVPNDALVCLVGRHVVGMQWSGWQTVLDTLTLADADKIKLSMNTYVDANLRHPQAVSRSADALTTLS